MSDELKLKLSLSKKGKIFTDEHRKNLSLSHKGNIPTNLEQLRTYRKGKPLSEEHKRKIGLKHKGKIISEETRKRIGLAGLGRTPWNKNLKKEYDYICIVCNEEFTSTQKSRKFCSVKCSSTQNAGSNNWRWIEDRTKVKLETERGGPLHKQWSMAVKKRDKWSCMVKDKDCYGRMESHHIISWKDHKELRYDINNGITLCHFHHPRKREDEIILAPTYRKLIDNYIKVKD